MTDQTFDLDFAINMNTTEELRALLGRDDLAEDDKEAIADEIAAREGATTESILASWRSL